MNKFLSMAIFAFVLFLGNVESVLAQGPPPPPPGLDTHFTTMIVPAGIQSLEYRESGVYFYVDSNYTLVTGVLHANDAFECTNPNASSTGGTVTINSDTGKVSVRNYNDSGSDESVNYWFRGKGSDGIWGSAKSVTVEYITED